MFQYYFLYNYVNILHVGNFERVRKCQVRKQFIFVSDTFHIKSVLDFDPLFCLELCC